MFLKALEHAAKYTSVSREDIEIVKQAKNSLLFHDGKVWRKKGTSTFDNTMGSYDGAETCECVGLFLLDQLKGCEISLGLYRDDGLGISNLTARQNDQLRKKIEAVFKENGLSITMVVNKSKVDFLDVSLDVSNKT